MIAREVPVRDGVVMARNASRRTATPKDILVLDSLSELLGTSLSAEDEDALSRAYGQAEKGNWEAAYNSVTFVVDGGELDSRASSLAESVLDDIEGLLA